MMARCSMSALLVILAAGCAGAAGEEQPVSPAPSQAGRAEDSDLPSVTLVRAFPRLEFPRPVCLANAGDSRLFVLEQRGRIRVFDNRPDVETAGVFLDIQPKVYRGHNEEGLLALAFHPRYRENGWFYVYYSANEPRRGVLSRFSVTAEDPDSADPASERVILEVGQPWGNHNGATVLFGPDGFLYLSLGDGGAAGDPQGNGQNLSTLLGSILRIDVDGAEPYAVPPDNPFVDRPGARGEIWAYGLRNVWRMSFDRETGDLWAGDVGQNSWEEIDLIVKGGNYGWNIREGAHPFRSGEAQDPMIDPVAEYPQRSGREIVGLSVTGGYVYRGRQVPGLYGAYVYGDYVTGRIWALRYENGSVRSHREIFAPPPQVFITSFGEDSEGELYVVSFDGHDGRGGGTGRIYRLGMGS